MSDYENDSGPDENDKLFDQLDELVKFVGEDLGRKGKSDCKWDVSLEMINLMMEEVNPSDIKIYRQTGGSWVAEVVYKDIRFVHITIGKHKPEFWDEIFSEH